MSAKRKLVVAAAVLLLTACDSGSLPGFQGESCRQASDCNSGLQCLDYWSEADGGCVSLGLQCLQPCKSSADCGGTGSGFGCYAACGMEAVCQPALPGMQDGGGD